MPEQLEEPDPRHNEEKHYDIESEIDAIAIATIPGVAAVRLINPSGRHGKASNGDKFIVSGCLSAVN